MAAEDQQIASTFFTAVQLIHASGAASPETSYYPALAALFEAAGKSLKPKVRCVMNLRNHGSGMPDGGLFTADQLRKSVDLAIRSGQLPARGAIEAKKPTDNTQTIAQSEQVQGYLQTYGIVIVTNLRQFLIVDRQGVRESFALADSADDFWQRVAAHPRGSAERTGDAFIEFIRRACLHDAPLINPKDVAWFLASYARDSLSRVEKQAELEALQSVRSSLEQALGMTFTGDKGEHFFRSTLVQTLFYGLFSAWVQWHRDHPAPGARFAWRSAEWTLHVPFIRSLYGEVARPDRLGPLKLVEPLDWAAAVLNRIDRSAFFDRFDQHHAVQYFYEPFLEAYDPQLRKDLGVWYTPPEIVKYQVARVDRVLREELSLPDGLADPNVVVLDPCCGTGAYLVEVLHTIEATLREKGGDALVAADLKQAAQDRIFGFEIMPAPFAIAHLQLGLTLQTAGAPLAHQSNERVGVFLTNALTGWEPPAPGQEQILMPWLELREERDAAERVKQAKKILVILGNPPYNAFAGVSPVEERGLVEPYKQGLNTPVAAGGWGIKKFNLDDLYVRFFRLAERRIAEMSGRGVVSFISNFSYLSDPSFVVMRQRFLSEFDKLWFDCMNGDSRETGKLTPEGKPDPSVFSTQYNREGIRVGTAICTIVRKPQRQQTPDVWFRQFWGASKRADLTTSLIAADFGSDYSAARPARDNRFSFQPEEVGEGYAGWPRTSELAAAFFNGPVERRGNSLIAVSPEGIASLEQYLDGSVDDEAVLLLSPAFMKSSGEFRALEARLSLKGRVRYDPDNIRRYPFKPLDVRYAYLDAAIQPLFSRPSPDLLRASRLRGNSFFITRDSADKTPEGPPFLFSALVCDYDAISGHARHYPRLLPRDDSAHLFADGDTKGNLSTAARAYLASLRFPDPDTDAHIAGLIWMHALAIGYSPAYLAEHADGIRRDWPRIPLPESRGALEASAALGEKVAALLDTEAEVDGVTVGRISPLLKTVGAITKAGGGSIDPAGDDLAVSAGWGHGGKGGVTMPGGGRKVQRPFSEAEKFAIAASAEGTGLAAGALEALLGGETYDVHLNENVYWRNVPGAVWDFYIGGYQVMKKWLSYREQELLGRPLKVDEAREVMNMARRLCGLLLLRPALDENYKRIRDATFAWRGA